MRVHLLFAASLLSLGLCQRGDSQAPPPALPQKTEPKRTFVVYSVADLVNNYPAMMQSDNEKKGQAISDLLCDLITQTIAPASWEKAGGAGKLEYYEWGIAIGVNQTKDVHEEITAMLNALRALQQNQVAMQVQLVSVPDVVFEKVVNVDWIAEHRSGSFPNGRIAFLNDAERKDFLDTLQKDKRTETLVSPTLRMYNGQKATINTTEELYFVTGYKTQKLDGAVVPVPQNEKKEIGFKAKVQATVSGDRRFVHINLDATRTALESQNVPLIPVQFPMMRSGAEGEGKRDAKLPGGARRENEASAEPKAANRILPPRDAGSVEVPAPEFKFLTNGKGQPQVMQLFVQRPSFSTQTVSQKFNVPDGGTTVIVLGKERRETRQVVTPPAAALLPFGRELFSTVNFSRETHTIVMLVTPRIVINEEIEREILGSNSPAQMPKKQEWPRYYFTGGKMEPKQFTLPVGYDLTVLSAIAINNAPNIGGGFGVEEVKSSIMALTGKNDAPFGQVLVLRRDKDGLTQRIVDLDRAMKDSAYDLVIRDGDVLILQEAPKSAGKKNAREKTHVFYTGGIDNPRQHTLPRDRELRVTQAIAGKLTAVGADDPIPGEVLVIRKNKSGEQTQIRVNLNRALVDPTHDVVVQSGDFLVLQETTADMMARTTRTMNRDFANIRWMPRDLSEPSEPRQSTPRR